MPEVVSYVENIITNGFAYAANGSVYFDTESFKSAGHCYRKLVPPADGADDSKLMAEGEGSLSATTGDGPTEKKCENDFVLWKKKGSDFEIYKSDSLKKIVPNIEKLEPIAIYTYKKGNL